MDRRSREKEPLAKRRDIRYRPESRRIVAGSLSSLAPRPSYTRAPNSRQIDVIRMLSAKMSEEAMLVKAFVHSSVSGALVWNAEGITTSLCSSPSSGNVLDSPFRCS